MLKSTEQFLYTYKGYLEELGYHFKSEDDFDPEKIFDCLISTIKRAKTYEDTRQAIIMFKYIMKKMDRFIKNLYKYPDIYDSFEYGSPELLSLVDEDTNLGEYWLMNGLFDKWDVINIIAPGQDWFALQNDHGKFSLDGEDSKYFLSCAKLNDQKVVICNSDGEKVCVAELDRNNNLVLNNNCCGYDAENDDGAVYFTKEDNKEKHVAGMFCDAIEEKEDYVLILFELYDKEADLELLMLLAASVMILYHNMVSSKSGKMLLLSSVIAGFGHGYR